MFIPDGSPVDQKKNNKDDKYENIKIPLLYRNDL